MAQGDDTVQRIKDKLTIVEVVTPYVKLVKAGKYYRGLSPFGNEKTPSFYVNLERGSYYCFSTSQGGDHFTFIQKMEGVDFKGALTMLAEKAGVPIERLTPENAHARDKRDRSREAVAEAETFFVDNLKEGEEAYSYALKRGLTSETITAWKLGLAPGGWRGLLEALVARGYTTEELKAAGLIKEADEKPGTWYDRFRNRLMFPIRDAAGRTVAFTGRALSPEDPAKYLNSPETELFKKSEILFGMDRAKDAIRSRGFAILVEGQFDLILLHQAGFTNTIALSGTALSSQHLSLIKRYADNLMLCLDADRAGLAASAKNAHAALRAGMRVKAVRLPEGKDPADLIAQEHGAKIFTDLVKNSQSIIEFFLSVLSAQEPDDFKLIRRVEQTVLPLVHAVKSPLEQNRYIEIVARSLSSTPDAVRRSLAAVAQSLEPETVSREPRKEIQPRTSPHVAALESRKSLILAAIHSYPDSGLADWLQKEYTRIVGAPASFDALDERALFEAGLVFGETPSEHAGNEIIREFEIQLLKDARTAVGTKLRKAQSVGDAQAEQEALIEYHELNKRITALS